MIGADHRMLGWIRCQRYLLSKYGRDKNIPTLLVSCLWLTNEPHNLLQIMGPVQPGLLKIVGGNTAMLSQPSPAQKNCGDYDSNRVLCNESGGLCNEAEELCNELEGLCNESGGVPVAHLRRSA